MSTLFVGDIVSINVGEESRSWGAHANTKDGDLGEVVGFSEIHYGRWNNFGHRPGYYHNRSWPQVKLQTTGEVIDISHCHVKLVEVKERNKISSFDEALRAQDFLRDLPDTPFWEGDKVSFLDRGGIEYVGTVKGINYKWVHNLDHYEVGVEEGWHTHLTANQLTLVERGPVWRYHHNEPLGLEGKDLLEFHRKMGFEEQIKNPRRTDYNYLLSEALEDIRTGVADCIAAGGGFFGGGPSLTVHRFRDREVGELARRLTMEGFANMTPEFIATADEQHLERRRSLDEFCAKYEKAKA